MTRKRSEVQPLLGPRGPSIPKRNSVSKMTADSHDTVSASHRPLVRAWWGTHDAVAEWRGSGLQSRAHGFDSRQHL